jgi:peptidoglycan/xylan/chitin deacetylase (PgdA/CDA1 family)
MGSLIQSLKSNLIRHLVETPRKRRLSAAIRRLLKWVFAGSLYVSGLTGILLRKSLRRSNSALILGYHGVTDKPPSLMSQGHSFSNMEGLIQFLKRHLRPTQLSEIVVPLGRNRTPPPASFVVTFDDGLLNNVTLVIPLLQKLRIPATFFVPSGLVGTSDDLWVASLTEIFRVWAGDYLPEEPGLWSKMPMRDERERFAALFVVKKALKACEGRRKEFLEDLRRKSGVSLRPPIEDRVVNPAQLRQIIQAGFTVGAHSRHHPILSGLAPAGAQAEITGSRKDLEILLEREVLDFAYPNGRFADFDETTRKLVAEAGFRCAVTTEPGTIMQGDDVLALRRCMPEDLPPFLTAFDLLIRVWKDRRRPADGSRPVGMRLSYLRAASARDAA